MDDIDLDLPRVFNALREDYKRMSEILTLLPHEDELAMRADLSGELVRLCAMVEDAKDRALEEFLALPSRAELGVRLQASATRLGEAMVPIDRAVRQSVPIDVHKSDPLGFETDLDRFLACLANHRALERRELYPALERIDAEEERELSEKLDGARRHTLEHPLPPHHPLARWLKRIEERLSRSIDSAEEYRPARDRAAS